MPSWAALLLLAAVSLSFSAYPSEPGLGSASATGAEASLGTDMALVEVGRLMETMAPYAALAAQEPQGPPQPQLSPAMAQLQEELEALVRSLEGPDRAQADIAVAVVDLQSGEAVSVDGDELHLAGCTIKLFPALKALHDVQEGRRAWDGWLDYLIQRTVRVSNNADSYSLIHLVGIAETNAFMEDVVGTQGSIITHAPGYYGENAALGIEESENYLTADDLALTFARLYWGELVTPELSSYVLDVMTQSWLTPPEYGVILYQAAPITVGVRVSHKIGYVGPPANVWNDAGLVMVDAPDGTVAYAVAILTQYNLYYWKGPPVGRQIAERVFQHFNQVYDLGY